MRGFRQSQQRLVQLAQVLAFASSSLAVSLQDFQAISISDVPSISCLGAYGSTIFGCARSDFQDGTQCSTSCANGVVQNQVDVITACRGVTVDPESLLGLTLQGRLLDALCPHFLATLITLTVTPTPTTFTTPSETQEPSSSILTTTTEGLPDIPPSISTSMDIPTIIPSETDMPIVTATSTETLDPSLMSPTSSPTPTKTSDSHHGSGLHGSTGGGSPFDPVYYGSSGQTLSAGISTLVAVQVVLFVFLMV